MRTRTAATVLAAVLVTGVTAGCGGSADDATSSTITVTRTRSAAPDDGAETTEAKGEKTSQDSGDADASGGSAEGGSAAGSTPASPTPSGTNVSSGGSAGSGSEAGGDLPTEPGAYADALVRAWGAGRTVEAELYATTAAAEELFAGTAATAAGPDWGREDLIIQDNGYAEALYRNDRGDELVVSMDLSLVEQGARDAIDHASFVSAGPQEGLLPTDPGAYGTGFVDAWVNGNGDAAVYYAEEGVLAELDPIFNDGLSWDLIDDDGSTLYFREAESHNSFQLTYDPEIISQGNTFGIVGADLP